MVILATVTGREQARSLYVNQHLRLFEVTLVLLAGLHQCRNGSRRLPLLAAELSLSILLYDGM